MGIPESWEKMGKNEVAAVLEYQGKKLSLTESSYLLINMFL